MKIRNLIPLLAACLIRLGTHPANSQCIVLNCPESLTVCPQGDGANVFYSVTATATCGTNIIVVYEPPSGSYFKTGTNIVTCLATNELGDRAVCSFPVIVGDWESPVLIVPQRTIVPCISPEGAPVTFSVIAEDNCDTNVTVVCDPPSGTVFPPGTNLVTCTATDASGNQAREIFQVIVAGGCGSDACVRFFIPQDMTVPCTQMGGAIVQFSAVASNLCTGGSVPVVCDPPSGSLFPVGLHKVMCKVEGAAAPYYASFMIEVVDETPPTVQCPPDMQTPAQSPLGAVVFFQATGSDDCSSNVVVRCSPPSGSVFPVGKTWVTCQGHDGNGNVTECGFTVEVTPPPPLSARVAGNQTIELRWTGDALLETKTHLDSTEAWELQSVMVEANGTERIARLPAADSQRFFRISPLPLLPPADEDGDGVPDDRDRCPGTLPGTAVDVFGCAILDVLVAPEGVFEPERSMAGEALRLLELDGGFPEAIILLLPAVQKFNDPTVPLIERQIPLAFQAQSNHVASLRNAMQEFQRRKPARMGEILSNAPRLDAEHADVRPQDFELMRLDEIEEQFKMSLQGSEDFLNTLSNLNLVVSGAPTRGRVQIKSMDERLGVAVLEDGKRLLLPRPTSPWAPLFSKIPVVLAPGSLVDVDFFPLPDGVLIGNSANPVIPTVDDIVNEIDPRCFRLRIIPAEVGLHLWDSGKRHKPFGYFWGANFNISRYYLEQGMGLAVVKATCPYEAPGAYKHWVKILKDTDNDGSFGTVADYIDENSLPVVLKNADFPDSGTAFPIIVREFRAPVQQGGTLGAAEMVGEETFMTVVRRWGYYADAFYSRTIFELDDVPSSSQWQSVTVNSLNRRYPLYLKPANEHTFASLGYKVNGNTTTFPGVNVIGLNQPFSVHQKDPNDDLFFAYTNDIGKGLYSPVVYGYRNGLIHQYRVTLPMLVRDRIVSCTGTDTYYRIPFEPVIDLGFIWIGGAYSVSQGNNGTFTHNGWQAFAWDFPKPAGTAVLAARGGRVLSIRETSTQSCWNSQASACQNCSGSASPNFVTIQHQDGTVGWYLHFQVNSVIVSPGQRVYRGDKIASVGTTGCSTGNHLHFDVRNASGNTVPARFEAFDSNQIFRQCFNPPAQSSGWSNNEPWWWPF